jgi:hypothetical protein
MNKTFTFTLTANVNNVQSLALSKLGEHTWNKISINDVSSIHTHCVEPVRPDGMSREEFFALDRIYTVEISMPASICEFCGKLITDINSTSHILNVHPEEQ